METNGFEKRHGITITSEWADNNKYMPEWKDANHYKVTLRMGRKQHTTYFSQGYGIKAEPDVATVLDALASDASGIENARSFEDWAAEYGYDTDSRKTKRIFKVCKRQSEKLKNFLGDDPYNELLWNTDRL